MFDFVVICGSSDEAAKAFYVFVAKTVLVEQEKEAVLSGLEVVFLSLHCRKGWLFLLEKWRVADHKRNLLLFPDVRVQNRLFFVLR